MLKGIRDADIMNFPGNMCGRYQQVAGGEVSSPVETKLGDLAGGARVWCSEVAAFASQAQVAAATLLTTVHFARPRLLRLPRSYDAIFQVRVYKHIFH